MKRLGIACSAAAVAIACLAPKQAMAGDGFAAGLFGGLAAGTLLGVAVSSPRVYYAEPIYPPTCYWTRGRPVYDEPNFHQTWNAWASGFMAAKFIVESAGRSIGLVFDYERTLSVDLRDEPESPFPMQPEVRKLKYLLESLL